MKGLLLPLHWLFWNIPRTGKDAKGATHLSDIRWQAHATFSFSCPWPYTVNRAWSVNPVQAITAISCINFIKIWSMMCQNLPHGLRSIESSRASTLCIGALVCLVHGVKCCKLSASKCWSTPSQKITGIGTTIRLKSASRCHCSRTVCYMCTGRPS